MLEIVWVDQVYEEFIKIYKTECKGLGLSESLTKILESTINEYVGRPLDIELVLSKVLTAPFPYANYKISRVNALHEAFRDYEMIKAIIKSLKKNPSLLMVGGRSHAVLMKEYLMSEIADQFGAVGDISFFPLNYSP